MVVENMTDRELALAASLFGLPDGLLPRTVTDPRSNQELADAVEQWASDVSTSDALTAIKAEALRIAVAELVRRADVGTPRARDELFAQMLKDAEARTSAYRDALERIAKLSGLYPSSNPRSLAHAPHIASEALAAGEK